MNPINSLFEPSHRRLGFAILRVLIGVHVFTKLLFLWPYSEDLFGTTSFIDWSSNLFGFIPMSYMRGWYPLLFLVGIFASLAMIVGVGRRLSIFIVFLVISFLQAMNGYILNGGDNLLKFLLLYLSFGDSFDHFAFRRVIPSKVWISTTINNFWTNVAIACVLFHLSLVYFISGLAKANSAVWYHGTALYYILQLDRFSEFPLQNWLGNHLVILSIAAYSVLAWELTFPFLVMVRGFRTPMLLFGLAMHMGIFIMMMIRDFEIMFIMIYPLFYTDRELIRVKDYLVGVMKALWSRDAKTAIIMLDPARKYLRS